ncbi:MAG: hypothetical protein U0531_14680 [Dehalococcoidia bacterium]
MSLPVETGVSYASSRDLRHVRADLADMSARRCSYVAHALSETDIAYNLQGMTEIVRATRDLGLEPWVYPLGACGLFPGEAPSRFLLEHPESWQVRSNGRPVPAACPRDPAAREYLRGWIVRAAEIGAQVALWDAPGLWTDDDLADERWTCRCPLCQDAYLDRFHGRMPSAFTDEVRQFREESLLSLVAELLRAGRRAGLRNALTLLPADLAAFGFAEAERRAVAALNRRRSARGLPPLETLPPAVRYRGIADWEQPRRSTTSTSSG